MAATIDDENDTWSDAEEADSEPQIAAITDVTRLFATAEEALAFDASRGFDLAAVARAARVDFYGAVKLLNYARGFVASGSGLGWGPEAAAALNAELTDESAWRSDHFLKPALEPDELLHRLEDVLALEDEAPESDRAAALRGEIEAVQRRYEAAAAKVRDASKFDGSRFAEAPVDASAPLEARLEAELAAAKERLIAMETLAL